MSFTYHNIFTFRTLMFIAISSLLFSCKKDEPPKVNNTNSVNSSNSGYVFNGTLEEGTMNTTEIFGTLSFDDKKEYFEIKTPFGSISGSTIEIQNDENNTVYLLSSEDEIGTFKGYEFSGEFNESTLELEVSGWSLGNGPDKEITASNLILMTLDDGNQLWWDTHQKTGVYFVHSYMCTADITINGETIQGLEHFYEENPCEGIHQEWYSLPNNFDVFESQLFCAESTIYSPYISDFKTIEECPVAGFILDKETDYTYTVTWEDGTVTEGSFKSPKGGMGKLICLQRSSTGDCGEIEDWGDDVYLQPSIKTNTLAIDKDKSSTLEAESDMTFNSYYFTSEVQSDPSITQYKFGSFYSGDGSNTELSIYLPTNMVEGEVYNLDNGDPNSVTLTVYHAGSGTYYYNEFDINPFIHQEESNGTVKVLQYNPNQKNLTLQFNKAIVSLLGVSGRYFQFSGTIGGQYEEE